MLVSDQPAGPTLWETGSYIGSHWRQSRQAPYFLTAHLEALAEQAVDWGFEDLRILLIVRRQGEWIASKCAQRSDRILHASHSHFEERIEYYIDLACGFYADGIVLDYALLRDLLAQAIGDENVLMLPYELFKHSPLRFLQHVTDFVSPSETYSREQLSTWAERMKKTSARLPKTPGHFGLALHATSRS